jgi:hypothetical protein
VVVAGAFERHNFGDLLMGRIMEFFLREQGLTPLPAGLLAADLRRQGGSWVHAFADLAPRLTPGVPIVHVGGETIPCTLRDGLRMILPAAWPQKLAAHLASSVNPSGLESREFAYLTPREETIRGSTHHWEHRFFYGQGASTLDQRDAVTQAAVARTLDEADWITARDTQSVASLHQCGLGGARFAWDCAVLQPCLEEGGLAALDRVAPRTTDGPLLVHANADFLNAHAEALAPRLAVAAREFSGVRVGLAGLAANHDTLESARTLVRLLASHGCEAQLADSPHADDIVAGIRQASCVVSTSLHYRIIALTHAVPRVSLLNPKTRNWSRSCDPAFPADCPAESVIDAVASAVAVPVTRTREFALDTRRAALATVQEMVEIVAEHARSPQAQCRLPDADDRRSLALPPDHVILPLAWIEAIGGGWEEAQAGKDAADEARKSAREEIRRLREELTSLKHSTPARIARLFRK